MQKRVLIGIGVFLGVWASDARAGVLVWGDGVAGNFTDISGTGTNLGLGDEDEGSFSSTVSNLVFPAGTVVVGNNGGIAFGPEISDLSPVNEAIPSNGAFGGGQALMPYWDDVGNDIGGVYYQEMGDTLIIQWSNRAINPPPGRGTDRATFQVKIFGPADMPGPNVYAQFIYSDINNAILDGGGSATIGYQDGGAGFNDAQWSFNMDDAVSDGTVLSLGIPEPGTLLLLAFGAYVVVNRRNRAPA